MIDITDQPLDPAILQAQFIESVRRSGDNVGAVVSFSGMVRGQADNATIEALTLEHYAGFTEKIIASFVDVVREKFDIDQFLIAHRYGTMKEGEVIVFVATASAHRRDAFEAATYLMDRLKTDAPFWKKEHRPDGEHWIEPTEADYTASKNW